MTRLARLLFANGHLLAMTLAVVAVAGLSSLCALPRIEDPRITNRNALVLTFVPGASAERVEALVTEKIEDHLEEVAEIKEIDSTSRLGLSVISVELADTVTPATSGAVMSEIRDKLADAGADLPAEAQPPIFDDKRGAVAYSKIYALSTPLGAAGARGEDVANGHDEAAQLGLLTRLAEDLADRIRGVPGTEIVRLYGESREEITVRVDHDELVSLGLTPAEVSARLRAADAKVPAGQLRAATRDVTVEVAGQLDSLERIRRIPLVAGDAASLVRLGDVADVEHGWRTPPEEIALVDGRRTVLVAARMQAEEHADRWAASVDRTVAALRGELGGGLVLEEIFDQSAYTTERLSQLGGVLIPDHCPSMSCAAPWHAGMAYAMGYMKAALKSLGA